MLEEKLAIFTVDYEVTEREVRNYMIEQWHQITIGMNDSTILFLIGVHGTSEGKLGGQNSSTMRVQMDKIFKRDAPELQKDKEDRNIKFEYLDLFEFIEDEKLNEDAVVSEIDRIKAQCLKITQIVALDFFEFWHFPQIFVLTCFLPLFDRKQAVVFPFWGHF